MKTQYPPEDYFLDPDTVTPAEKKAALEYMERFADPVNSIIALHRRATHLYKHRHEVIEELQAIRQRLAQHECILDG